MATKTLYLGPSYPSVNAMPAPNRWQRKSVRRNHVNESGQGNLFEHLFAQRQMWQGEWLGLTNTDMNTVLTELNRTRTLAMVDMTGSSYTVLVDAESVTLDLVPGTNPLEWNVQATFKQAL